MPPAPSRVFALPPRHAGEIKYDPAQTYRWNYQNAPVAAWQRASAAIQHAPERRDNDGDTAVPPGWTLCGQAVSSPIGIAAGPLLNGRWVLHYADLGYDVLTYKTVRSRSWPCYELPNLLPVRTDQLDASPDSPLAAAEADSTPGQSWAVSFGMPSAQPAEWQVDVAETRQRLPADKTLSVSVVASPEDTWQIEQIAEDYAACAVAAQSSGADMIELNLSCPNVSSCDGQLYRQPALAQHVVRTVRQALGAHPLLIKIGQLQSANEISALRDAVGPWIDAVVTINCIPANVQQGSEPVFGGKPRGIAGPAIYRAVLTEVERWADALARVNANIDLVAVGGIDSTQATQRCLDAGAAGVQVATYAMQ